MYKFKGHTKSFKKQNGKLDCQWFTFKDGDVVPNNIANLVLKQGGELEETIEKKEEPKVEVLTPKVKKKAKRKKLTK